MCPPVKQESQASDHVKVSAASRAKSEPMTAAQLFMPSEVYKYLIHYGQMSPFSPPPGFKRSVPILPAP